MRAWNLAIVLLTVLATPVRAGAPGGPPGELLAADAARMQAMVAADVRALDAALGDDLTYGHSTGQVEDKHTLIESLRDGTRRYHRLAVHDAAARLYGDTGVVTGTADADVESHGQARTLRLRYTATYVREHARWVLVAYQSTSVPSAPPATRAPPRDPRELQE